jgi:hypothetical protein
MVGKFRSRIVGVALGSLLFTQGALARAERVAGDGVLTSGVVTFGLGYAAALMVASTSHHAGDNRLYVPLLGPWLDLSSRGGCPVSVQSCDGETTNKVLLVGDGLIQAIGVATILSGLMSPSRRVAAKGFTVAQIVPVTFGNGRPGLAAYGSF